RAAVMDFGIDQRQLVTLPYLAQPLRRPELMLEVRHANRLEVDVKVHAVRARLRLWVALNAVVEEPLAREIVIDAQHVRLAGAARKFLQRFVGGPRLAQPVVETV